MDGPDHPLLDPALPVTAENIAALQAKIANLFIALESRDTIGMAKGILMATHRLTDEEAFRLLSDTSQATHRKVHQLAAEVVHTGALPGVHSRS